MSPQTIRGAAKLGNNRAKTFDERFFAKVHMTSGCWVWTGARSPQGYGMLQARWLSPTPRTAHSVMNEQVFGAVPEGLVLDHLCRNRACVRPDHLEPVSMTENNRRGNGWSGRNSRKTHCPHGHPLDRVDYRGYRYCSTCKRARDAVRDRKAS